MQLRVYFALWVTIIREQKPILRVSSRKRVVNQMFVIRLSNRGISFFSTFSFFLPHIIQLIFLRQGLLNCNA